MRKFNDEDYNIISLKTDGLALIREKNKFKSGNQSWEVILLDTALQETGTIDLDLDMQNRLVGYEHAPGFVYFLFVRKEFKGEMDVLSINLKSKETARYEIRPELNFQLTQFCKAGDNFIFGGYVNMESAVILYTPVGNNVKIVPGFFQKNVELIDLRTNHNQTFNTILMDRGDRASRKIIFRTFDSNGKQLLESITDIEEDIVLQNGISSALEREDLMIFGTWGKRNGKQASGLYTLSVNPFTKQKINRTYFGQLEHYLDYLKPKRAASIKAKTLSDLKEGRYPDFTSYVKPFRVVEHTNGFLLLAESYIPSSSSNQYYSPYNTPYNTSNPNYPYPTTPYGAYYPSNRLYIPNYEYGNNVSNDEDVKSVHSVVIAFDVQGNARWDHMIKLEDIKRPSLDQVADFHFTGNFLQLLYKKESELKVKKINISNQEVSEFTEKIKLNDLHDEIRSEGRSDGLIKQWFGANFYVWGRHSIRNRANSAKTREVFYINKVVVR